MKKDNNFLVSGFLANAVSAGLKKTAGLDLSLIFSQRPAVSAGVFTTNKVKAAPVLLSQERIKNGILRGIVINAGYANACTGKQGLVDAITTSDIVARHLKVDPKEIAVASTGVIGAFLPVNLIKSAVPDLTNNLSPEGFDLVAEAIRTTDSFPKLSHISGNIDKKQYNIVGIAKGAGMIMPHMATMLSFILTDVNIDINTLRPIFLSAVETTFNRITVDGDTSTNDTVLIMANGAAENKTLGSQDIKSFEINLMSVMERLSMMIARDGEGATKLVTIEVNGAATKKDAHIAARTVANSPLVKTTIFGQDPNWGRIMAALGRAQIDMEEDKIDIWVEGVNIVKNGLMVSKEQENAAAEKMKNKEITIAINLNKGAWKDRLFTCDFTYDYIRINAAYRT